MLCQIIKNLNVWILSMETVKEIYEFNQIIPKRRKIWISYLKRTEQQFQYRANIAEGLGRNYRKDTIQFLHVSRGSAYEVETLLSVAQMINIIDEEKL